MLEISGVFFQTNVNGTVPSGSHRQLGTSSDTVVLMCTRL
jgi:hypothetical protein